MWQSVLIVVLISVAVPGPSVTAVRSLKHMRQINDKLDEFLSSSDNVKVVYFLQGICQNMHALSFYAVSSDVTCLTGISWRWKHP